MIADEDVWTFDPELALVALFYFDAGVAIDEFGGLVGECGPVRAEAVIPFFLHS